MLSRYPNGDMRDRAEREYRRAAERAPCSIEALTRRIDTLAAKGMSEWRVRDALFTLDRWLPFCTARIIWLRGDERKREIRELVAWFRDAAPKLEFDRTVGAYVVR